MKSTFAYSLFTATAAVAGIAAIASSPDSTQTDPLSFNVECIESSIVSTLFAPGTDPAIVEMVSQAIQNVDNGNSRYQTTGRWPGTAGTPIDLTYSFPSDGVNVPNGVGEGSGPNTLNATLASKFGSVAAGKAKFAEAFAQWAQYTGVTYTEVSDDDAAMFNASGPLHGASGRGDIRIVMKFIDGGSGILAYNFFPGSNNGGDMVLDQNENWGSSFNNFRFFRNTITHEHGHGQGVLHVCPVTGSKLMEPFLNTGFDGPQHDEVRATTKHYGDRYEPNPNAASAAFLGFFAVDGSFGDTNLALRNGSDNDYFSIDVDGAAHIDVSADPVGFAYLSGQQTQSCNTGNQENSDLELDPAITVFDTDGSTVLASSNSSGLGSIETLNNVALPSAGTYFILINGAGAFDSTDQIYDLDLAVTIDPPVGCVADLNGDMIVDTADLGILLANFGNAGPAGDLNGDGVVDTADLGILLGVFGTCVPI